MCVCVCVCVCVLQLWTQWRVEHGPFPVSPPDRALVAIQTFLDEVPFWRSDVGIEVPPPGPCVLA
jgi:hypothetical protein